MGVYTQSSEVEIRENRLNSIGSYSGDLHTFIEKSKCGSLTGGCGTYEQCGHCSQNTATGISLWIKDTVVITHAPVGCGLIGVAYADCYKKRAHSNDRQVWHFLTNISEDETIYGASEKLRATIHEADRRYHPRAIFIHSSCVAGIIGEDFESIALEEEENLGYPIVPIYCEGFKSKVWSSGFDAAYHAILRKLVHKTDKRQDDLVNIFNFIGDDRLKDLIEDMGLRTNYVVPFADLEKIQSMGEAKCSVEFCETLSTYVTQVLEEEYGVIKVKTPPPFGITRTDNCLREIGKYTGKEQEAENVIHKEHIRIQEELDDLREKLRGKKVFIMTGDTFAFHMASVVKDLGMEIVGITALHHDQKLDGNVDYGTVESLHEDYGNIDNINVCGRNPYQAIKIIQNVKPDLVISRHFDIAVFSTKLGIPCLPEGDKDFSIGYEGVLKLGRRAVRVLKTHRLIENIAEHSTFPYSKWWAKEIKDPYYLSNINNFKEKGEDAV